MKKRMNLLFVMAVMAMMTACINVPSDYDDGVGLEGVYTPSGGMGQGDSSQFEPGVLTAAEWNDLDHWDFWCDLIRQQDDSMNYAAYVDYWAYQTSGRVGVQLMSAGSALVDAKVALRYQNHIIWQTKTDNRGRAELWIDLYGEASGATLSACQLLVNDVVVDAALQTDSLNVVECSVSQDVSQKVDVLFIVDATGSMGDEMDFLKEDLMDVLLEIKAQREHLDLRTAALFYRDEGDDYVVKYDGFTPIIQNTVSYIKKQEANGGGDYPEAVHTALTQCVQLPWSQQAYARLAFMFLDAPAHDGKEVQESLHAAVRSCATQGIKLIPVAASGVDKSTEFMLRYFAMTTCGTYVFLTDDSGVGNSHMKPSVGDYQVMSLNALMKNLILRYTE